MKRPEQKLLNFLKDHHLTIAFAESMTCGMAAMRIGNVSGTSEVFAGSIVCYDTSVKTGLLKIAVRTIKKYTAESQQVTDNLAKHLTKKMRTDVSAAITGLAAPGGSETKQKPVGTVFISVYFKRKLYRDKKKFNGSPLEIKEKACDEMFIYILNVLRKKYRK
jgi:nicotinamide-nucleotide amidase